MLTTNQKQQISAVLYNAGHANVQFVGKHVIYRDQTKGARAMDKMIDPQTILEFVDGKSLYSLDKFIIRLIMLQVDPSKEIWPYWGDWITLPDQVYEMTHWTNNPATLLQLAKDSVFCEFKLS